jgi:dGTPase
MTRDARPWEATDLGPRFGPTARLTGPRPLRVERSGVERHHGDLARVRDTGELARLAGIGQVFTGPGPGYTSRRTHSIEVSTIAARLADGLDLSTSLAAAIGLAHDCGHPPLSHVGEEIVASFSPAFSHASYGAERLAASANLSPDVLDGIRNHSWSCPNPATPEGELVRWADRIAYLARDFADSVTLGLAEYADLPPRVARELGHGRDEQVDALVDSVVTTSRRYGVVCMGEGPARALAEFRRFNLLTFYRSDLVMCQAIVNAECLRAVITDLLRGDRVETMVEQVLALTDLDIARRSRSGVQVPSVRPIARPSSLAS